MPAAITIHFRKPELTAACIDSLLNDGWGPILVWDNSADEGKTLAVLQMRYSNQPRVLWGVNATNLGFGGGMNAALALLGKYTCSGPVLLINNDAKVKFGMKSAMLATLQGIDGAALVAPRIRQDEQEHSWLFYQPWLALVTQRPLPGSFAYLSGCCLLVHRDDNTQPLFDEEFFMYGEDVELSWRWRRQGGSLVLLDHAWLTHDGSASSGQASEAYERFLVSSHWLLARKLSTSSLETWGMYMARVSPLLIRACLRALRYRSLVPLWALTYAFQRSTQRPIDQTARR